MNATLYICSGLLLASSVSAQPTYFVMDNGESTLTSGVLGVNNDDVVVAEYSSVFWGDLANFNGSSILVTNVHNSTINRISVSTGHVENSFIADREVRSIAYDSEGLTYYGMAQNGSNDLFSIDPVTGATTTIATFADASNFNTYGIGFDRATGNIAMTLAGGALYMFDIEHHLFTFVGHTNLSSAFDISYNPNDGNLYAFNHGDSSIYMIDRTTAEATFVNTANSVGVGTGLAFVPSPGTAMLAGAFLLVRSARRRRVPC